MLGAVQSVIACLPAAETVAPCPAGSAPSVLSAYLIEPVAQAQFEASVSPTDFAEATSFWLIAFSSVLILWSLSYVFGQARRAIR